MEFLTPGKKIKKLRIDLDMNQQELEDRGLSRGFISMIELDKRSLSRNSAKTVVDKFNEKAKKLGIQLNIDKDYILNSPAEDAQKYCLDKLNNIEKESEIPEIIKIANRYDLDIVRAKTFEKLGDIKYDAKDYTAAFISYSSSIDASSKLDKRDSKLFYLNNRLGICKVNQLMYKEAVFYFDKAYNIAVNSGDIVLQKKTVFNLALCYRKIGDINKAIKFIDRYLLSCDKEKELEVFIRTNILKAVCYAEIKDIDKAESIYNELINDQCFNTHPLLANVYNNLGFIYLDKEKYIDSLDYFNKSQQIRADNNSVDLAHTLIEKAEVYKRQGLYTEAIMLIKLGLEESEKNNDLEYLIQGHYKLGDIYKLINDNVKLEKEYEAILELLSKTDRKKETIIIYSKMSEMFLNMHDMEKTRTYLNKSLELLEKD